jgi:hypothetical protein
MMSAEEREQWEGWRRKGPARFILFYGVVLFGAGFTIAALVNANRQGILTWRVGLGGVVIWLGAGAFFGWVLWLLKEREYHRSTK